MRIPLDYYRILGLPIQASAEQLEQAYRDRIQQLPRREYSELAIEARRQLLDEAYAVLSDPEQRSSYDASFLTKTYASDSPQPRTDPSTGASSAPVADSTYPEPPSIDIKDEQFVGALLILQELGEYELVLKLGSSYLSNTSTEIERGKFGEPKIARADIVLTVALASLELGREQWQQRRYEDAALSLANGQELLLSEGLFAGVRGEIQSDLYKLRPYRILELVALPEENAQDRRKGLHLLQQMLQERGGMDGNGDDQSGLGTDNFLRFIQQLRVYLTSAEQQGLFEEEAKRPSAVGTYLAVYALLARGFTQRQPELIRRAKQLLTRLGKRQDVYLEQAICALLIGQTEEAARALELSGEYESLAFIREHSQGAPDLLPGLCLYSERWLQEEVFPHFRDLAEQQVSLKDYFADEKVQTALESLPPETEATNEWEVVKSQQISAATAASQSTTLALGTSSGREISGSLRPQAQGTPALGESKPGTGAAGVATGMFPRSATPSSGTGSTTFSSLLGKTSPSNNLQSLPTAERVGSGAPQSQEELSIAEAQALGGGVGIGDTGSLAAQEPVSTLGSKPFSASGADLGVSPQRRRERRRSLRGNRWSKLNIENWFSGFLSDAKSEKEKQTRLILLAIAGVLGIGLLLFLLIKGIGSAQKSLTSAPSLEGEQPMVRLDQSLLEMPEAASNPLTTSGQITKEVAQQVIETWLSRKAEAFGRDHQTEQLAQILVNPALSRWETLAQTAKRNNLSREYEHTVQSDSLQMREVDPNQTQVEVRVREVAKAFKGERPLRRESYSSNVRVRYDLVRQNGQWYIRDMAVLK